MLTNFRIVDLLNWICLLQIVEKLVDLITYMHQAISELLGNNGTGSHLICISILARDNGMGSHLIITHSHFNFYEDDNIWQVLRLLSIIVMALRDLVMLGLLYTMLMLSIR